MPNNCLSVLYKHIIQVENKNVGLKVGGHKHTIAPPPPLPTPVYIYIYMHLSTGRKEENVLFNDTLNTFYLRLYSVTHMVKDHSDSDREETHYRHMGYSYRLTARVLLYAPSHRQDNTYHGLCYTSRGALAGMRKSSMGIIMVN